MEQDNSSNGNDSGFFQLYALFLEIDSVSSFINGRNRFLIQCFCNVYCLEAMRKEALKNKDSQNLKKIQNKLKEGKESLKNEFRKYISQRGRHRIEIWADSRNSSTYPYIIENPNISEVFSRFVEAIEQYGQWRSALNDEQLLVIYRKNLEDRQKYYGGDECFKDFNEELLQKIDISKLTNNKMLKQALIEFHNAISHLVAAYYGKKQERNKERAINHFKRGALDSYKAIIKDFYHLYNAKKVTYKLSLELIENIRKEEYLSIGSDNVLFEVYKNITDPIISKINEQNKPQA